MVRQTKSRIDKRNMKKLSYKEQKALLIYLKNKCTGIGQAMIEAGYTKLSSIKLGTQLLQKEETKAIIQAYTEKALQKYSKSADDVLSEISILAFSDIKDYFDEDDKGNMRLKPLSELGEITRAIKEIKHVHKEHYDKDGNIIASDDTYQYKLYDKLRAQELLGDNMRLFTDKQQPQDNGKELLPRVYLPDNGKRAKAVIAVEYQSE